MFTCPLDILPCVTSSLDVYAGPSWWAATLIYKIRMQGEKEEGGGLCLEKHESEDGLCRPGRR